MSDASPAFYGESGSLAGAPKELTRILGVRWRKKRLERLSLP